MNVAILDDDDYQIGVYKDSFLGLKYNFNFFNHPLDLLSSNDLGNFDIIIIDHSLDSFSTEEIISRLSDRSPAKLAIVATYEKDIFKQEYLNDKRISNLFCKFNKNEYNFDDIINWIETQKVFKQTMESFSKI